MAEADSVRLRAGWVAVLLVLLSLGLSASLAAPADATVLCSNSASPCPEGDAYSLGTELHGVAEGSVALVSEKIPLACGGSTADLKPSTAGTPLLGQLAGLTFSSCSLGCKVKAANLPYKAEFSAQAEGDATVSLSSGGKGPPRIELSCLGKTCAFGTAKASTDLSAGSPALISAASVSMAREAGEESFCGKALKWSGIYRITEPMAVFAAFRSAPAIALCSSSTSPCPEGKGYPIGIDLRGALSEGQARLMSDKGTVFCGGSTVAGSSSAAGTPITATVTSVTFSSCAPFCSVSAQSLPYWGEIEASGSGNGTVTLSNGGSGQPALKLSCPGYSCTFSASSISLDLSGGSPASIAAVSEPLTRSSGEKSLCGDNLKWEATYQLSEPSSLYMGVAGTRKLYFGISANTRSDGISAQEQVVETGANRLREDVEWKLIEPSDDSWSWPKTDTLFSTAAERGLTILPILNAPPCWATGGEVESVCERTYPTSDAEYAEFVSHVAARYGPGGEFWTAHPELDGSLAPRFFEIWNEPYIPFFVNGDLDPARYASLYKAAVIAGRSANAATRYLVESTGDLMIEGKTVNWPDAMLAAEPSLGNYVDGIAIHPYPYHHDPYYQPSSSFTAAFAKTQRIYDDWNGNGVNRPIWITEIGYSSCTDIEDCMFGETQAKREELKAIWLAGIFDQLSLDRYAYVHAVYLYNLRQWEDPETAENDSSWYGTLNKKAEHLPAWTSFAEAVEDFDGTPFGHALITSHVTGAGSASFTFALTDPTASASCQLDAGAWTACTSPLNYSGLSAGPHTFRVKATNAEGTEPSPAVYSW